LERVCHSRAACALLLVGRSDEPLLLPPLWVGLCPGLCRREDDAHRRVQDPHWHLAGGDSDHFGSFYRRFAPLPAEEYRGEAWCRDQFAKGVADRSLPTTFHAAGQTLGVVYPGCG